MSAEVASSPVEPRSTAAQPPFLLHQRAESPPDLESVQLGNLRPDLQRPAHLGPARLPLRSRADAPREGDFCASMRPTTNCESSSSAVILANCGEYSGAMAEPATSAATASYPSVQPPHANPLPAAYNGWSGAVHGRAASFDYMPNRGGLRNTSARRQSNAASFASHQKQPSEQFDSLASRLWLHSPSFDLTPSPPPTNGPSSKLLPSLNSSRNSIISAGGSRTTRGDAVAASRCGAADSAFSTASSRDVSLAAPQPPSAVSAATEVTEPASASAHTSSVGVAGSAAARAGVCRPRRSPCRRTALGIADLMALRSGKPKTGARGGDKAASAAAEAAAPISAASSTAPPSMAAGLRVPRKEADFRFPSVNQSSASSASAMGAQYALRKSPPHNAQFVLRKSPPHPRGSAASRFPRSASDGHGAPRGSSAAKPVFPPVIVRPAVISTGSDAEPLEAASSSSDSGCAGVSLPSLHQACSSGSAVAESSRGGSRVGKSRLGQGRDGSGSNSSSRDASPANQSDNGKCDSNEGCDSIRDYSERRPSVSPIKVADCVKAAEQSALTSSHGTPASMASAAFHALRDTGYGSSGSGSSGNRGNSFASGSRKFAALSIPSSQGYSASPSSPTFRPSPLSPRGPSPLSPRVASPHGPPLSHRHPSPLSPFAPPPVSLWDHSPLSPHGPSPLSPRRPSPLSPRGPSPLSPRRPFHSPLSPRGPSPLSPRVGPTTRTFPEYAASDAKLRQQYSAGAYASAATGADSSSRPTSGLNQQLMQQSQQLQGQQQQLAQRLLLADLEGFRSNSAPAHRVPAAAAAAAAARIASQSPQRRFSKGRRALSPLECSPACSPDIQRVMNRHLLLTTRSDSSILPSGACWATESAAAAVSCCVPKSILAVKEEDEGSINRTRSLDRRVRFNREVEVHVFS